MAATDESRTVQRDAPDCGDIFQGMSRIVVFTIPTGGCFIMFPVPRLSPLACHKSLFLLVNCAH